MHAWMLKVGICIENNQHCTNMEMRWPWEANLKGNQKENCLRFAPLSPTCPRDMVSAHDFTPRWGKKRAPLLTSAVSLGRILLGPTFPTTSPPHPPSFAFILNFSLIFSLIFLSLLCIYIYYISICCFYFLCLYCLACNSKSSWKNLQDLG